VELRIKIQIEPARRRLAPRCRDTPPLCGQLLSSSTPEKFEGCIIFGIIGIDI